METKIDINEEICELNIPFLFNTVYQKEIKNCCPYLMIQYNPPHKIGNKTKERAKSIRARKILKPYIIYTYI